MHHPVRIHAVHFLAGLALMIASLACGAGAGAPPAAEATVVYPEPVSAPTQTAAIPPVPGPSVAPTQIVMPAMPERRRVTLEYPAIIRLGDSDVIRLTLEVDDLGNLTPTAETPGNTVGSETIEVPNLYETHNVIAEARLDLAGVEVRPPEMISSPVKPGQAVTFYWSVKPGSGGTFKGTAWLFLRFVDKATGLESQRAVSAQTVEIQSTELFGLSAGFARTTGAIGSVVGGILGFPFFDDIIKAIYKRVRRK